MIIAWLSIDSGLGFWDPMPSAILLGPFSNKLRPRPLEAFETQLASVAFFAQSSKKGLPVTAFLSHGLGSIHASLKFHALLSDCAQDFSGGRAIESDAISRAIRRFKGQTYNYAGTTVPCRSSASVANHFR